MAVHSVTISLLGYYRDGSDVPGRHFLGPLVITPEDHVASTVSDQGRWATSQVIFPPSGSKISQGVRSPQKPCMSGSGRC